jgi:phosphatidylserine decarboxylase
MSALQIMVRDAYPILIPLALISILLLALSAIYGPLLVVGVIGILLTGFVAYFFRDPERQIPSGKGLVVSPADGKVVVVEPIKGPEGAGTLVSIFLSVFDVHVNRTPVEGRVSAVEYRRGKFMIATDRRASIENEQSILTFESPVGPIVCKQIAGLIARRIVYWIKPGSEVGRGDRFGLIKFGSRVDLILPAGVKVEVRVGDRVKGGESVIGKMT